MQEAKANYRWVAGLLFVAAVSCFVTGYLLKQSLFIVPGAGLLIALVGQVVVYSIKPKWFDDKVKKHPEAI